MGGIFEKSLARSPFRYAPPRPRTPAPAPQRGGVGAAIEERYRISILLYAAAPSTPQGRHYFAK